MQRQTRSRGFPPLEPKVGTARTLVLGSLPGAASLAAQQYYAHPRNVFWQVMAGLLHFSPQLPYDRRAARLETAGIALWDVLAAGVRPGSLDADIVRRSEQPNDIGALLRRHPTLSIVAFNGKTAAVLFKRHVAAEILLARPDLRLLCLPSTSPAHAGLSFERKFALWRAALGTR